MFSEDDSFGEEIDIFVKLFLSSFNAYIKAVNLSNKEKRIAAKDKKKMLSFHQQQTFSLYLMCQKCYNGMEVSIKCEMVLMKDMFILLKINSLSMKKTDTKMPTLLTKLLQPQCIVNLNENNSLHQEKVYERNPS